MQDGTARRTAIRDLAFRHNTKPTLGVEVLQLADLFARERAGELPEPLTTPQRPQFTNILVGLTGKSTMTIDLTAVPIGAGHITVFARGRVQAFQPAKGLDAWLIAFSSEFLGLSPPPLALSVDWVRPTIAPRGTDHRELLELAAQLAAEHARPLDAVQPAVLVSLLRALVLRIDRYVQAGDVPPSELQRFFATLERDCLTTRHVAHYAKTAGFSARQLGDQVLSPTHRDHAARVNHRATGSACRASRVLPMMIWSFTRSRSSLTRAAPAAGEPRPNRRRRGSGSRRRARWPPATSPPRRSRCR